MNKELAHINSKLNKDGN